MCHNFICISKNLFQYIIPLYLLFIPYSYYLYIIQYIIYYLINVDYEKESNPCKYFNTSSRFIDSFFLQLNFLCQHRKKKFQHIGILWLNLMTLERSAHVMQSSIFLLDCVQHIIQIQECTYFSINYIFKIIRHKKD